MTDILEIPISGVLGLINEESKEIYILSSVALLKALGELLQAIKLGTSRCSVLNRSYSGYKIILLEKTNHFNRSIHQLLQYEWCNKYNSLGYSVLNKRPIKFRKIITFQDGKAIVKVVNTIYKTLAVISFESMSEANAYYDKSSILDILKDSIL